MSRPLLRRVEIRAAVLVATGLVGVVLALIFALPGPRPRFEPGVIVDYLIPERPGEPRHHVRTVAESVGPDGYSASLWIPETGTSGYIKVGLADQVAGRCLPPRLHPGDNSGTGCTSFIRLSDVIYRDMAAGRPVEVDYRGGARRVLEPDGSGRMAIRLNNRVIRVRFLKAVGPGGAALTTNDDSRFPFVAAPGMHIWTPDEAAGSLRRDLDRKGRFTTGAILASGSGDLDAASVGLVDVLSEWLKSRPDRTVSVTVRVGDPGAPDAALPVARVKATAIAARLVETGIERTRISLPEPALAQGVDPGDTVTFTISKP